MATVIDSLVVTLGLDPTQFTKAQKEALAAFAKTKDEAVKSATAIEEAGKKTARSIETLTNRVLTLFAVLLGGRQIKEFVSDITSANAALGRLSANLNTSPTTLSAWQQGVERAGGTAEDMAQSFQSLSDKIQSAKLGFADPQFFAYLNRLGAAGGKLINLNKSLDETLIDLSDDLGELAKKSGRPEADFIGRQLGLTPSVVNFLITNSGKLRQVIEEIKKTTAMNAGDATAATSLQSKWVELRQEASRLGTTILTDLTPHIIELMKAFEAWAKSQDWKEIEAGFKDFIAWAPTATAGLRDFGSAINSIVQALGGWKAVTEGLFALWLGSKFVRFLAAIGLARVALTGVAAGSAAAAPAAAAGGGLGALLGSTLGRILGPIGALIGMTKPAGEGEDAAVAAGAGRGRGRSAREDDAGSLDERMGRWLKTSGYGMDEGMKRWPDAPGATYRDPRRRPRPLLRGSRYDDGSTDPDVPRGGPVSGAWPAFGQSEAEKEGPIRRGMLAALREFFRGSTFDSSSAGGGGGDGGGGAGAFRGGLRRGHGGHAGAEGLRGRGGAGGGGMSPEDWQKSKEKPGSFNAMVAATALKAAGGNETEARRIASIMHGVRAGEHNKGGVGYAYGDKNDGGAYGPWQYNMGKGRLGDVFKRQTGVDPRDPRSIPAMAEHMAKWIHSHPNASQSEIHAIWHGYRGPRSPDPKWGEEGYRPIGGAPPAALGGGKRGADGLAPSAPKLFMPPVGVDSSHDRASILGLSRMAQSASAASHRISNNNLSNEVNIGQMSVNTNATDAAGIARDIHPALQRNLLTTHANYSLA